MSAYQIRKILLLAFLILMITYYYTLIHLGPSYSSEMQNKVLIFHTTILQTRSHHGLSIFFFLTLL